jgi:hypothetical protein
MPEIDIISVIYSFDGESDLKKNRTSHYSYNYFGSSRDQRAIERYKFSSQSIALHNIYYRTHYV